MQGHKHARTCIHTHTHTHTHTIWFLIPLLFLLMGMISKWWQLFHIRRQVRGNTQHTSSWGGDKCGIRHTEESTTRIYNAPMWYMRNQFLKAYVGIPAAMAHTQVCTQDVTHHTEDSMQFKDCSIVWRYIITHTKCEIWTARCFYWDVYEFLLSPPSPFPHHASGAENQLCGH